MQLRPVECAFDPRHGQRASSNAGCASRRGRTGTHGPRLACANGSLISHVLATLRSPLSTEHPSAFIAARKTTACM
jgi:hypothetical protein